jgi:hypothetical protein
MSEDVSLISKAFNTFSMEAQVHAQAWGEMVQSMGADTQLDPKTGALV